MRKRGLLSWEVRLGHLGESEVKARLQRFSTVTKIETDVGLDFYCETIVEDNPRMPFYIQAKSTEHLDRKYGRAIGKNTIRYWLTRPFPVYLIVYDNKADICYWRSIELERYRLLGKLKNTKTRSIYISVNTDNILEKGDNPALKNELELDRHSLELYKGSPRFVGKGYVKSVPMPPRTLHEYVRIAENARACLYSLLTNRVAMHDYDSAIRLAEAVALFDKSHYNHFAWLGYLYKQRREFDKAGHNYRVAIDILERDSRWDNTEKRKILDWLRSEIESISS